MGKRLLAIDIGNRNTKLVWGHYKSPRLVMDGFTVTATPDHALKDDRLADITSLAQTLEREINEHSIKPDHLVFTISGPGVITRDIQLPKSTETEIAQIISFDAQQFFPIDLKDYVYDFKILEHIATDDGDFTKVMLVAALEGHLDDYMKLGEILDIDVAAIDINHNCVYKMIHHGHLLADAVPEEDTTEIAVIGLGHKYTNLSIYAKRKMKFSRSMPFGSGDIDNAILKILETGDEAAERYKIGQLQLTPADSQDEKKQQLLAASVQPLERLLYDLHRLFDFYKTNYGSDITRIYLCGGGGKLQGLDYFFRDSLGIPVQVIDNSHLSNVVYRNKTTLEDFQENIRFLIPAMGALIRN